MFVQHVVISVHVDMELVEESHNQSMKLREDQITRNDVCSTHCVLIVSSSPAVAIGTVQETV